MPHLVGKRIGLFRLNGPRLSGYRGLLLGETLVSLRGLVLPLESFGLSLTLGLSLCFEGVSFGDLGSLFTTA